MEYEPEILGKLGKIEKIENLCKNVKGDAISEIFQNIREGPFTGGYAI